MGSERGILFLSIVTRIKLRKDYEKKSEDIFLDYEGRGKKEKERKKERKKKAGTSNHMNTIRGLFLSNVLDNLF